MMKKIMIILLCLVICPLFFIGCNKDYVANLRFVEYIKISPNKPDYKKEFYGYIKAGGETQLSFQSEGQIKQINFTNGENVKKGQIIATIDNEINRLNERGQRVRVQDAYIKYANAKSYYDRMDKLHAVGAISDKDWEAAKTDMESSKNQIDIAQEMLASAGKKSSFGTLYAPSDGIILQKLMEANQYAKPGDAVVIFQDNRKTEAKLFISEKDINNVYVGQEVTLNIKGIENTPKTAYVSNITKTSIGEGSYMVTLKLKEKYIELKDGMAISAFINLKIPQKAIIQIPVNSVLEDENSSYVWVLGNVDNGIAIVKRRNIKTGDMTNDLISVEYGLRAGDKLIVRGVDEIMDGQKVRIKDFSTGMEMDTDVSIDMESAIAKQINTEVDKEAEAESEINTGTMP